MSFRPTFWPTLITVPMLAVLVALGVWQLQRMEWKATLIEELKLRGSAPAIALPSDDRIPAADLLFRPVTLTGSYMHEAELHLLNRVRDGVPGINLITPLLRSDGGPPILVDRGWVPLDWKAAPLGAPTEVTVTGVVRRPPEPGLFTPQNRPGTNDWYYLDLVAMAGSAGILPFPEYYIYAIAETPAQPPADPAADGSGAAGAYPLANEWRVDLPNDHLSYAVTWFVLAGALAAIYLLYHTTWRRRPT